MSGPRPVEARGSAREQNVEARGSATVEARGSAREQKPVRLGFVGVGWIGQARMCALLESGAGQVVAIADPSPELRDKARALASDAQLSEQLESLLEVPMDGVVIATPSAMHARQASQALERGLAVFCQKPLARTAQETRVVVEAARRADCLLRVDLSYRQTQGMMAVKQLVDSGELGSIYHARLVFHNAYGPDKAWYYDVAQAGGGCVMDLGVHLVDLALWLLDFAKVEQVDAALYAGGERLRGKPERSEDFATARLELAGGTSVELACSWNLPAGQDAVIAVELHGTRGGVVFHNVNGSFYDFRVERLHKGRKQELVAPPDAWGGRTLVGFAEALGAGARFDAENEQLVAVAAVLDRIYQRG
jgi:predicted dehydrogenase